MVVGRGEIGEWRKMGDRRCGSVVVGSEKAMWDCRSVRVMWVYGSVRVMWVYRSVREEWRRKWRESVG